MRELFKCVNKTQLFYVRLFKNKCVIQPLLSQNKCVDKDLDHQHVLTTAKAHTLTS